VDATSDWLGEEDLTNPAFLARTGPEPVIDLKAPYNTAKLFLGETQTLHYHRGGFFEWDRRAYPAVDDAMMRARLYGFLEACRSPKGPVKPNTRMVSDIFDSLRAVACLDAAIAPPAWLDAII
jgi:hypothetical protein